MSDCEKCKFYHPKATTVLRAYYDCPMRNHTDFSKVNSGQKDCPHWWPNNEYTYSEGEWEHRCNRMPTDTQLLWDGENRAWYLWAGVRDELQILFCPFCPLELQPMPEVKE